MIPVFRVGDIKVNLSKPFSQLNNYVASFTSVLSGAPVKVQKQVEVEDQSPTYIAEGIYAKRPELFPTPLQAQFIEWLQDNGYETEDVNYRRLPHHPCSMPYGS